MFALALWDAGRERLVLARDRVGKKPLLWTRLPDGTIAFASELKALLRLPGVSRELDPAALDAYLALQYVPSGTALRGIEKLPPGHLLVAERGEVTVEPYWRLEPRSYEGDWLELVRETVGAAVRKRLVAGRAARRAPLRRDRLERRRRGDGRGGRHGAHVHCRVRRTTATTSAPYARAVAERYGTEHEEIVVEPDVTDLLPRLAAAFDEPLGDEAALPAVRRLGARAPARHRGAHGRRRRRGVRRVRAVRGGRARGPGRDARGRARRAGAAPGRARGAALAREPRGPPLRGRRAARRRPATGG